MDHVIVRNHLRDGGREIETTVYSLHQGCALCESTFSIIFQGYHAFLTHFLARKTYEKPAKTWHLRP